MMVVENGINNIKYVDKKDIHKNTMTHVYVQLSWALFYSSPTSSYARKKQNI